MVGSSAVVWWPNSGSKFQNVHTIWFMRKVSSMKDEIDSIVGSSTCYGSGCSFSRYVPRAIDADISLEDGTGISLTRRRQGRSLKVRKWPFCDISTQADSLEYNSSVIKPFLPSNRIPVVRNGIHCENVYMHGHMRCTYVGKSH